MEKVRQYIDTHPRRVLLFVAFFYTVLNISYLINEGIWRSVDTTRYLNQADLFVQGGLQEIGYYYLTYVAFVAFFKWIQFPLIFVGITQILLSFCALFFLGKYILKTKGGIEAILTVLFLCVYFNFWKWNTTIMTESLYCSLSIFWACILIIGKGSRKYNLYATGMVVLLAFTRPNGWMLFLVHFVWLVKSGVKSNRVFYILISLVVIFFAAFVLMFPFTQKMISEQSFIHLEYGTLIWGYWDWHYAISKEQMFQLNVANILHYLKIFSIRVSLEFTGIRPYFSVAHNILVGGVMGSLHLLAVLNAFSRKNEDKFRLLSIFVFVGQFAIVAVTFADWEGRFAYQVLPFTTYLAVDQFQKIALTIKSFIPS